MRDTAEEVDTTTETAEGGGKAGKGSSSSSNGGATNAVDGNEGDDVDVNDIPFHWDKDEVMAGAFGVWLHPQLSEYESSIRPILYKAFPHRHAHDCYNVGNSRVAGIAGGRFKDWIGTTHCILSRARSF